MPSSNKFVLAALVASASSCAYNPPPYEILCRGSSDYYTCASQKVNGGVSDDDLCSRLVPGDAAVLGVYEDSQACEAARIQASSGAAAGASGTGGTSGSSSGAGNSTGGGSSGSSYDYEINCPFGMKSTAPIPVGDCEKEYERYADAFGCNLTDLFYETCLAKNSCTGEDTSVCEMYANL